MTISSVTLIGLGYVGLPTAAIFADCGLKTYGYDVNKGLIDSLQQGIVSNHEPGLKEMVSTGINSGRLEFVHSLLPTDAYVIAVPTPITENHSANLDFVFDAAKNISSVVQAGQLIILESTSPVGTTARIAALMAEHRPELDFSGFSSESVLFAYCPERVFPGNSLFEIVNNERLIGGLTEKATQAAKSLYERAINGNIIQCNSKEAEMSKLVENSFRDVNIAFSNEVARLSSKNGVDSTKIIQLANLHPRVNVLQPGVGVGGHCIPVDPWFLLDSQVDSVSVIKNARTLNDQQPQILANEVLGIVEQLKVERVFCFGLGYKPDSDDVRESPAIHFVQELASELNESLLFVVDPLVDDSRLGNLPATFVEFREDYQYSSTDLVVILVGHSSFSGLNFGPAKVIEIFGTGQTRLKHYEFEESSK